MVMVVHPNVLSSVVTHARLVFVIQSVETDTRPEPSSAIQSLDALTTVLLNQDTNVTRDQPTSVPQFVVMDLSMKAKSAMAVT